MPATANLQKKYTAGFPNIIWSRGHFDRNRQVYVMLKKYHSPGSGIRRCLSVSLWTPNYEGLEVCYPKFFLNFGTLKRHSQRFGSTYKVFSVLVRTPNYEGLEVCYPKLFFNFGTLKRHSQRFWKHL